MNLPSAANACSRCILTADDDPELRVDERRECQHCAHFDQTMRDNALSTAQEKERRLAAALAEIKNYGRGHDYDCLIGVSGGIDSSYLAFRAKRFGLRPLIMHFDNGWNSELAVMNIENIVKRLDCDLYTHVNDWNEFRDLQLSFFKASVVDIELITDHAIAAIQFALARKFRIKYVLSGANLATEAILPRHWHHWKLDLLNITSIHDRFGKLPLKTFPQLGFFKHQFYTRTQTIRTVPLLDYLHYDKEEAKRTIIEELGWRDYGGKHYESIFTRFYQAYILPRKFHIDKRKAHLSTLICSGQMTRGQALAEMRKPIFDTDRMADDKEYVTKKLGLTADEFEDIMRLPVKQHLDYPSYFHSHYKHQAAISAAVRSSARTLGLPVGTPQSGWLGARRQP